MQALVPSPERAGYLASYDQAQSALDEVVVLAEKALGDRTVLLREQLRADLLQRGLREGSLPWKRAWSTHWRPIVLQAVGQDVNGLRGGR